MSAFDPQAIAADTLAGRWQRLQMQVRCALHPLQPERIALFLHCGAKLARRRGSSPAAMQRRMLHTLLLTAQDAALPPPWRRACMAQAERLLAGAAPLMRLHAPQAAQALEAALRDARGALCAPRPGLRQAGAMKPGRS